MRKIIAALFMIVIILPLLVITMSLMAMRLAVTQSESDTVLLVLSAAGLAGLAVLTWIAADNSRERVAWVGSALLMPALTILAMGFAINSELVGNVIQVALQQTHYYSSLYTQMTTSEATTPILRTIAGSFSQTGMLAAALAVILFVVGTILPDDTSEQETSRV